MTPVHHEAQPRQRASPSESDHQLTVLSAELGPAVLTVRSTGHGRNYTSVAPALQLPQTLALQDDLTLDFRFATPRCPTPGPTDSTTTSSYTSIRVEVRYRGARLTRLIDLPTPVVIPTC